MANDKTETQMAAVRAFGLQGATGKSRIYSRVYGSASYAFDRKRRCRKIQLGAR
jgi:hypothetical protein